MVVIQGKPDILKHQSSTMSDQLLDLDVSTPPPDKSKPSSLLDDDLLGLSLDTKKEPSKEVKEPPSEKGVEESIELAHTKTDLVADLLDDDSMKLSESAMPVIPLMQQGTVGLESPTKDPNDTKSSRQKGLQELDLLGESLLKQHLPGRRSPQFEKKKEEKLSLHSLQQKQKEKDLSSVTLLDPKVEPVQSTIKKTTSCSKEPEKPVKTLENVPNGDTAKSTPDASRNGHEEVKLADLNVPISSIKPGQVPPMTLQESEDGISIVLHFGQDCPRDHVFAIVVTVINKLPEAIADYELKAVVPKGCKVKVQAPTTTTLPAHNPFVPPSALTQVMLIANPLKKDISLKYIVSYSVDGEPQTEMGQVEKLPI